MAGSVPRPPRMVIALASAVSEYADKTDIYYDSGQGGWVRRNSPKFSTIEGIVRQSTGNPLTKE